MTVLGSSDIRPKLGAATRGGAGQAQTTDNSRDWATLPSEILFQISLKLHWRDVLALDQVSSTMRKLVAKEPLIWTAQVLKTYSKEEIPQVIKDWLSHDVAPTLDWRAIFRNLLRRCPATSLYHDSGSSLATPSGHSVSLVTMPGSDCEQVLHIPRRAAFNANFDALPPGRYAVMARVKLTPGQEAYINFSSKFNRKRTSVPTSSLQHSLCEDPPADEHSFASSASQPQPGTGRQHGWLTGISSDEKTCPSPSPPSADVAPARSTVGGHEHIADNMKESIKKKFEPALQFLLGSSSSSWQHLGRPLSLSALSRMSDILSGSGRGIRASSRASSSTQPASAPGHAQDKETADALLNGGRCKKIASGPPNEHGWQNVLVGYVTIRRACRSTRLSFVTLSINSLRNRNQTPQGGSIYIDHISLQPAGPALKNPLTWLLSLSGRAPGNMAQKEARLFTAKTVEGGLHV